MRSQGPPHSGGSVGNSAMTREDWQEYLDNVYAPAQEEARVEAVRDREEADEADRFSFGDDEAGGYDSESSGTSVEGGTPQPKTRSFCFHRLCKDFGVITDVGVKSVGKLSFNDRGKLWTSKDYKVYAVWYDVHSTDNHVEAVDASTKSFSVELKYKHSDLFRTKHVAVTTAQQFFGPASDYEVIDFYADREDGKGGKAKSTGGVGFGDLLPRQSRSSSPSRNFPFDVNPQIGAGLGRSDGASEEQASRDIMEEIKNRKEAGAFGGSGPGSVVDEGRVGGAANLTGGVARPKKRSIQAKQGAVLGKFGMKNYRTAGITMFNNLDELFLDKISRVAAQEIIESLFNEWRVPMQNVNAVSYAEDLLWAFLIARTASNKADYSVEFEVPVEGRAGVAADFDVFSRLLASTFGVTRRAFARGVADDLKSYLSRDENKFMLPVLAQRLGADPQMATLCFDGSTHCSGLTTSESSFTKLLEARNLFERDDVIADGASSKLMQGMSGGVRSVVPR